MARKTPEINSSSQADIAFLLLCFFLMTTSMDVDYGITRRISQLKDLAKDFMTPRPGDETAPEVETKTFDLVGDVLMSKGVISLQNDRGTSYSMYISVQNELARAFNEMKEDLAWKKFHKHLDQLNEDQTKAINDAVPVRVSEAEPVEYKSN